MPSQFLETPRVAIIIINWNGYQVTFDCLESLRKVQYPAFEILLVDNGSVDQSAEKLKAAFPEVTLLPMGRNLGFVGGNNAGICEAQARGADLVLLLNNDTEVAPDFLDKMVAVMQSNEAIGAVGPAIYYFDQPNTVWSAGGDIDLRSGRTRMRYIGESIQVPWQAEPHAVDFVTGCAILVKMAVIQQVGMLDPRFFAYYEETEWCVRMRAAGYTIYLAPAASVWHKISLEAREQSPLVHYYMTRNRLLFIRLAHAGIWAWINTLFLDYLRTIVSWTVKPKWRQKREQRNAMLRAILDYGRGRFGKADLSV